MDAPRAAGTLGAPDAPGAARTAGAADPPGAADTLIGLDVGAAFGAAPADDDGPRAEPRRYRSAARSAAPGPMAAAGAAPEAAAARWRVGSPRRRNTVAGAVVLVVILAIVGYALSLHHGTGRATAARSRPTAAPSTLAPVSTSPASTPSATPSQSSTAAATTAPAVAAAPPPTHQAPPAPVVRLSASVSMGGVVGFGSLAGLNFTVTNVGPVTSAIVTARISLPAGMTMSFGAGTSDGWTCSPAGQGAVCTHEAITPGASGSDVLSVLLSSSSACGRPIELTVTSRFAHASASAPVRCGHRR